MLSVRVIRNRMDATPKAARVCGLLNSVSPVRMATIWTVAVVIGFSGLRVMFAMRPAAMTTIIVSPIALEIAMIMALIMLGVAIPRRSFVMISYFMAPRLNAESVM